MPNKLLHADTYCYARFVSVAALHFLHKILSALCAAEQGVIAKGSDVPYKLDISGLYGKSLAETVKTIEESEKRRLGDLLLFDLLLHEEDETALRHGIYLFFDESDVCVYVGMCSSSHFAHRIGGHFGMSPKYGMNTFLRRAVKGLGLNEKQYGDYVAAIEQLRGYSILLIDANKKGRRFIRSLEKLLHILLRPRLNFPKGIPKTYKPIPMETSIGNALDACGGI